MNDFSQLEVELKKLRPAAVSPELQVRVACALEAATITPAAGVVRRQSWLRRNWITLGLSVAAATALVLLARMNVEPEPIQQNIARASVAPRIPQTVRDEGFFVPAGVTQVVYNTRDEGLVFNEGADRPQRRVRTRKRETMQWRNEQTGASLRVSYPAEEVELIPVAGQ